MGSQVIQRTPPPLEALFGWKFAIYVDGDQQKNVPQVSVVPIHNSYHLIGQKIALYHFDQSDVQEVALWASSIMVIF